MLEQALTYKWYVALILSGLFILLYHLIRIPKSTEKRKSKRLKQAFSNFVPMSFALLVSSVVCIIVEFFSGKALLTAIIMITILSLIVIGAVTLMLEICFARDKKDLFFYFTYYIGVSFTAFLGECYGTFSGAWNNADEGFLSLPWHRILITYFLAFFVILKFGELIYFFVFKKLFTGFMDTEP